MSVTVEALLRRNVQTAISILLMLKKMSSEPSWRSAKCRGFMMIQVLCRGEDCGHAWSTCT